MRNEPLYAYSLHQRPYQDKRSIYYLLTKEYGILHGIAKKGIPQFVPLMLFATGKKSLKTLQQVNIVEPVPTLIGQQQYAALYVNEITLKLLPVEDSMPIVYDQYSKTIAQLQQPLSLQKLKLVLRFYEQVLFNELGFGIDLEQDSDQAVIEPSQYYYFVADKGWVKQQTMDSVSKPHLMVEPDRQDNATAPTSKVDAAADNQGQHNQPPSFFKQQKPVSGETIITMQLGISSQTVDNWTDIHRQLIDHLFDYQPLQSRILWQQFYRYQ